MTPHIIVIGEYTDSGISPVTFELMAVAEKLSDLYAHKIITVFAGLYPDAAAMELSQITGFDVLALSIAPDRSLFNPAFSHALRQLLPAYHPSFICLGNNSLGMDIAPPLAVDLDAACITGVAAVNTDGSFSRPVANGAYIARIKPERSTTVLTVQPGAFSYDHAAVAAIPGVVLSDLFSGSDPRLVDLGVVDAAEDTSSLTDARVVVAGGCGFKDREELSILSDISGHFSSSAVAGSRPMIDQGWMPYKQQVGVTGAIVAPDLYLACGISGSTQHLAGMAGSAFVVSVNNDPGAAIFNVSDVNIVEDVVPFLNALDAEINKQKNNPLL